MYAAKLAEEEASTPVTWWYIPVCELLAWLCRLDVRLLCTCLVDFGACLMSSTRSGGPSSLKPPNISVLASRHSCKTVSVSL